MSVALKREDPYLTPEAYFEAEEGAQERSEYFWGETFAMSGGTANHAELAAALTAILHLQLRTKPCKVYSSDLRVRVDDGGGYVYPDLSVACGGAQVDAHHNLLNPTLIVEVLSASTEALDRGLKFQLYRALPTLSEVLLVSQYAPIVERFSRQPDGSWMLHTFSGEEVVPLTSVDAVLPLAELYQGITFEPSREGRLVLRPPVAAPQG